MKGKKAAAAFLTVFLAAVVCAPVVLVILGSVKSGRELAGSLEPVLTGTGGMIRFKLLPLYPTTRHFIKLLFWTPDFFSVFWNSVRITVFILIGQLLVSVPSAWAFAAFKWKWKNVLFTLYVILMLLPFQVTMLPSYLVLNKMNLMDTQAAVILPAVFSRSEERRVGKECRL